MHPNVARTRSRVATAHRLGDPSAITTARRDLAAAKIEDFIERTLAAAPPLTDDQRHQLAALLRSGRNEYGVIDTTGETATAIVDAERGGRRG